LLIKYCDKSPDDTFKDSEVLVEDGQRWLWS
jgi:hypothetical protein